MGEKGKLLPVCLVCGQVPANGIKDGVVVAGKLICQSCEKELITLQQDDSRYPYFIEKVKKLWM